MRTTLVCELCRAVQGDIYCIPISGVGDVVMCDHVVESIVRIHQVVEERTEPELGVAAPR